MLIKNPASLSCGVFYCLLFIHTTSQAQPGEPFATRDQNPLVSIYGMPLPVNARLLPKGDSSWLTTFNITNTVNLNGSSGHALIVDTETSQLNLLYALGLAQDWMLRMQFDISHHGTGFFDNWIYNYHDFLGLKQGDRDFVDDDQFQIQVSNNNTVLLDIQTTQTGLGDTQIQIGKQLTADTTSARSVWLSIKLPTGDSTRLTGSGATDIALWLATQHQTSESIWLHAQLGGLYMGDSDILRPLHQNTAWFGNAGLSYAYNDALQLKTQLDVHTPMYNSQFEFLDSAIQLAFGGSYDFDQNNSLDIAMSEDIKRGASPDVTLTISWVKKF